LPPPAAVGYTRRVRVAALLFLVTTAFAANPTWEPRKWADESTLELRTTAAGESEHWFKVWLVVIDDQLYVRLGGRAAGRIESNQTKPFVGLRIAGQQFDRVRGEPAPEMAGRVWEAMGQKYWSDVVVRHFDHPLVLRLVPEPAFASR
jgi:hypothetical protein